MKLRIALLSASILAVPFAVRAQPIDGLYIGAGAGANLLQTEAVRGNGINGSDYKFDVGPVVVASVGYGLGNGLRFELQGAYYQNGIRGLKTGTAAFGPTSTRGDEYKEGVFVNALYDIPLDQFGINSPVFPYVGVGVGYVHNQFDNLSITGSGFFARSGGQNDNFGVQGIAGVSFPVYDLVPGLSFTAEYRFLGEPGGRSYNGQIFSDAGTGPFKQKFATDDFNHSILVGVRYAFNTAQPAPPPPVVQPVPAPAPARTYLVFFDWDRADLTDRARQIITEAAQASTRVQYTRIEVQGNADRSGTPAYNQKLSLRRAQTVAAELVRQGVPRTAIDIQAFGDTRPLVPTAPGVREPQNRRVAIILK
jgi:OmpA-OmpF porin, OOP family